MKRRIWAMLLCAAVLFTSGSALAAPGVWEDGQGTPAFKAKLDYPGESTITAGDAIEFGISIQGFTPNEGFREDDAFALNHLEMCFLAPADFKPFNAKNIGDFYRCVVAHSPDELRRSETDIHYSLATSPAVPAGQYRLCVVFFEITSGIEKGAYLTSDVITVKENTSSNLNGWYATGTLHLFDGKYEKWYFYKNGKQQTGWVKSKGKWYYLDKKTHAMKTNEWLNDKDWYYLGASGKMQTGWTQVGKKWYYMARSGKMQTGWLKDQGKWYYLKPSGAMATGWEKVGGKWYYFNSSGQMLTGRQKIGGKWYRFASSGKML